MPSSHETSLLPVFVPDTKVWLDVCSWSVAAGFPSPAADHTRKRIDLNEHLIRNGDATFIFKVKGDSMIDAGIYEGDALLIDRSIEPRHGNIVLAVLNNDFTVKRLHKRGGVIKLVPENKIYPTITVKDGEDFDVWGVVTYNLHKLY
ncbi:translesion error-prone DNA polymerase V autoproteolytic subunit [Limnohabitans sp. JUR4]|uniref:Translesion error-prone DNA polymerase V autoproteolytic subunit n=1 Tax=Limnohabitans radicicola TaxID=2771427 RepID=A0A927ILV6_9BURK|nr:translesion error-prone DNA polymerase V autoproteolytic subunit [Limnohabitans radicicola]MBD8051113.1 translesion error-prone DNA polymerase V autoproteolytic subunit [Limnohabitans radicicola]